MRSVGVGGDEGTILCPDCDGGSCHTNLYVS